MTTDGAPVYGFDSFRLDVRERRLTVDGRRVPLTTKVLETLSVLRRGIPSASRERDQARDEVVRGSARAECQTQRHREEDAR